MFVKKSMFVLVALVAVAGLAASQLVWLQKGTAIPVPTIPRGAQIWGAGAPLKYMVMGDSTAVSHGSTYDAGFAVASARYLARSHRVIWQNTATSGARAYDVVAAQLPQAVFFKPDVVLIAVGANDVTHAAYPGEVRARLASTIATLQAANPDVRIILTGAPDMGSPPQIPQPLRWLAGQHTLAVNEQLYTLVDNKQVFWAPIAERTGPAFRSNSTLFARDKFHPNADGYALWTPVIIDALKRAGYEQRT